MASSAKKKSSANKVQLTRNLIVGFMKPTIRLRVSCTLFAEDFFFADEAIFTVPSHRACLNGASLRSTTRAVTLCK